MKNSLLLLGLFLLIQCNNGGKKEPENSDKREEFFEINYENILRTKKSISLSDIASDVRYIPFETGDDHLITRKPQYYFSDSLIFVGNYDHILVYDYSGKFMRQIGTPGRGPGEIDLIRVISVMEKEKIIIVQTNWSRKLMYFSFDGKFIKSITVPVDAFRIQALSPDQLLLYYSCSQGFENYLYVLSNVKWDTISTVNNHFKWTNNTGITGMIGYDSFKPFYQYHNHIFFKSMYNDTVYTISDNKIRPVYFINLGKYVLPNELRPEPPQSALRFRSENANYFFASVIESGEMVFVTSENYKANIRKNILFDCNTAEGVFLVNKSNEPSGFINNWDSGMEFWPEGNVNDNEIFMTISSIELKNMLKEGDFNKATARFPEKKQALKEMIDKLNETDNPVLMLVKLKR